MLSLLLVACTFFPDDKALPDSVADDSAADDSQPQGDDSGTPDDSDKPDDSGDDSGDDTAVPDGWPAQFFAPYVDATAYPTPKLGDIQAETGTRFFVLGFIVAASSSTCTATWGTYYDLATGPTSWDGGAEYTLYEHIARVREGGGDVMVSFGGAANTELGAACESVEDLVAQYSLVVDTLQLSHIDFDIEGGALADVGRGSANERRAQAIAQLQADMEAAGRPLSVWFTLPVLPSGLTTEGMTVLRETLREGVKIAGVNVMTMDYGDSAAPNPDGQMGQYGIDAITALKGQLGTLYGELGQSPSDAELWAMVGSTPMIGRNDVVTEIFQPSDAQLTVDFAEANGVGMLSMWSLNRDHPCPNDTYARTDCSSTPEQTADWTYLGVFNTFAQR